MYSDLLPVYHETLAAVEVPEGPVEALRVHASDRLCVLKLLLHLGHHLVAFLADEATLDQLRFCVSSTGYSTVDGHQTTQIAGSEVSDLSDLWQLVDSQGVVHLLHGLLFLTRVLMHELGQSPSQVWLKLVVVLHNVSDEVWVLVVEASQVAEVHVHRHVLLLAHLASLELVVSDGLVLVNLQKSPRVLVVAWIVGMQFKARE